MSTTSARGMTALCISLAAITTAIVTLRLYVRKLQKSSLHPDDWAILLSYTTFMGVLALGLLGCRLHQFGYDKQEVAAFGLRFGIQADIVFSIDVLACVTLGFSKVSALLFYRRTFCVSGQLKGLRLVIHVLIATIALWMIAFVILPILQCGVDLWKWNLPNRSDICFGSKVVFAFVISDFVLEAVVICLPIPRIMALQTSIRRRLAVLFVFMTAFVSLGVAIARLVVVNQILSHFVPDLALADSKKAFLWILEAGFALIAVNLPSLWWLRARIPQEGVLGRTRKVLSLLSSRLGRGGSRASGQNTKTVVLVVERRKALPNIDTAPSSLHSSIEKLVLVQEEGSRMAGGVQNDSSSEVDSLEHPFDAVAVEQDIADSMV